MFTINQLKNYATVLKSGKETFWASDFGFRGGDINGLTADFIEPTGREKEEFVNIGGDKFKKVTVREWRVRRFDDSMRQEPWQERVGEDLDKAIRLLYETADLFRGLGY